jgi:protein SCO1/2
MIAAIHALAFIAAALGLLPVHGVIVQSLNDATAIVRTDPVTQTLPSQIARYRVDSSGPLPAGTGIDALLDRSTTPWTLRHVVTAAEFAPGTPDRAAAIPVDLNGTLPSALMIDQNGKLVHLDRAFLGKTTLLSFVFTRCPDRNLCPAISGKYAYLQSHLDPKRFALVEITLDPPYDSPAVLHEYGGTYGADARMWTLLTGTGSTIARVLDGFGISSLRISSANFIHSDKLFIVSPQGRITYAIDTAGWDPDGVLAEARSVAGLSSNPFERFRLSLIAGVVAFCGGSQFAGAVLLELALFTIITVLVVVAFFFVARALWPKSESR